MAWGRMARAVGGLWLLSGCGGDGLHLADAGSPVTASEACSPDAPCADFARCIASRCVPTCREDAECGARERCGTEGEEQGLCVVEEADPAASACAGKLCTGSTPGCHPVTGACVACSADHHCPASEVCDRGRGVCTAVEAAVCAPCRDDGDCAAGQACLDFQSPFERVCVAVGCTGAACEPGFRCSPARDACLPVRGSCTARRAADAARACDHDGACSALGVSDHSLFAGACQAGACGYVCEVTPDCPTGMWCSANRCSGAVADAGTTEQADGGV